MSKDEHFNFCEKNGLFDLQDEIKQAVNRTDLDEEEKKNLTNELETALDKWSNTAYMDELSGQAEAMCEDR